MDIETSKTEEKEINFLDPFIVLIKRKRLTLLGALAVAVVSFVVCQVMSPVFEGTTKLMPPQQSPGSAAIQMMGQMGGGAGAMVLGAAGAALPGSIYSGIVQTPAVQDPLIQRFDLLKVYGVDTWQSARKILTDRALLSDVDVKSGIVWITVEDTDPQRAAAMADQSAEELTKVLEKIQTVDDTKKRVFFEGQLRRVHDDLTKSEIALQSFEESSGVLKIDDQASAALQGIAALQAQIAAKEVALKVMKTYATTSNPDLKKGEEELRGLKAEAARLEAKQENYVAEAIIPTGHLPSLGTEYLRVLRDFKYNEALNELITKQYQAAIVDEARESASVQVINKAPKPEMKSKPNLILVVPIAGVGGFIIFGALAFLFEYLEKVTVDPENEDRMRQMKKYFSKR